MTRYLLDSSALWRILRDTALRTSWAEVISLGIIGSCHPQRVEFRRSARTVDEYEQMSEMFDSLYPDTAITEEISVRSFRNSFHNNRSEIPYGNEFWYDRGCGHRHRPAARRP
ncbi:MAG: hypothetical protein ABSB76_25445 [Streptosporangiaceae bacterium]